MNSTVEIMDIPIVNMEWNKFVDICKERLFKKEKTVIYTPNPEVVMLAEKDKKFKDALLRADYCTPDGIGLIYAAKIRKKPLKGRITGFNLSIELLKIAQENNYSVYLLGAKKGYCEMAKENLVKKYHGLNIVGYHHGYFKGLHTGYKNHDEEKKVIQDIKMKKPDIIFVGFGAPKQELWIDTYHKELPATLFIGNGGTIDILSGNVKNTPEFIRKMGFEWLYRLCKNPERIKRQMVLPKFLIRMLFSRKTLVK
jgi:N-acetylglucosaminyldiphosphoundecaprenol N-acetyl-beta-D-mannosaminyltransferase